ncbi:MAG: hypothetical protein MJZ27_10045 [Bacteroidales bacterium]|nr:hypothetical protein [Bacteroidales bacterium]
MEEKQQTTSAVVTLNRYLGSCTPRELAKRFEGNLTISKIMQAKEPSLAAIKRVSSEAKVKALIKLQCVYLNEMLNLKRPLTEAMIDRIADDVMKEYYYLSMADVYLVFDRAIKGYWGEFYELVNVPMVEGWFRKYADERFEIAERRSIEEAESYKSAADDRGCKLKNYIKSINKNTKSCIK